MTLARSTVRWLLGPRGLVVALVLAAGLRIVACGATNASSVNMYEFGTIGKNIVDGRGYSFFDAQPDGTAIIDATHTGRALPSAFMPPVYTYTVAGALEVTHTDAQAVRVLQALNIALALVAVALVHQLGKAFGGPAVGRAAALGFAVYPAVLHQATQVSASNLYVPVELAVLVALLALARRAGRREALVSGVLLGGLCLLRSEALLLIPMACVWAWLALRALPRSTRIRLVAALLLPAVALPAAWLVRNSVTFRRPVATITTTGGFNLWIGNHDGATGSQKKFDTPAATTAAIRRVRPDDRYELSLDRVYLHDAVDYVTHDVPSVVVLDLKKAAMMLTVDTYDHRTTNPAYVGAWFLLLALAVAGAVRYRGPVLLRALLYGYMLFGLVIPTLFFALSRYKLTLEVPALVLAGFAVARWLGLDEPPEVAADGGPGLATIASAS